MSARSAAQDRKVESGHRFFDQPSLVLLDLVMPPPDGYQILRILRARDETRDLPVVVLTASGRAREAALRSAGATGYLTKPFSPVALIAEIEGALAKT